VQGAVYLKAEEIMAARPFTHPKHVTLDHDTLRYMLTQIGLLLEHPAPIPNTIFFTRLNNDDWFHRLVLPRPDRLRQQEQLTVVGFFGQSRKDADPDTIGEFDRTLIAEIEEHDGLLSYSSMALSRGNFGNLVLFADEAARDHWNSSQAHAHAAQVLAPRYYLSVRIYNGRLPGGITHNSELRLTRVKYYDYRSQPMWRAVREIA
jgi:hypothetical protein